MSFQGADVSGLDRIAQRCQQGADYAKKIAIALKLVVRPLRAMAWAVFAGPYAQHLERIVIPWVDRTGDALDRFANVVRLASALQKSVSEDSPQISIPATAYQPPPLPANTATNPPVLLPPQTQVNTSPMPTGAAGAGAVVIIPVALGGTASTGGGAASGGGANVTTPTGPSGTVSTGAGSATGGGAGAAVPPWRGLSNSAHGSLGPASGTPASGAVPPPGAIGSSSASGSGATGGSAAANSPAPFATGG